MQTRLNTVGWIEADWPAPKWIGAGISTRQGGCSVEPYASLNLGLHVGDQHDAVMENRLRLKSACALPSEPVWLNQVHGVQVVNAAEAKNIPEADASYAVESGVVCAVMTADCLPVLLCDREGSQVAAVHAGWRGLVEGVIEATVNKMAVPGENLMAWLGPAIGSKSFEVGEEVRDQFVAYLPEAKEAFLPSGNKDRWLADIYLLARQRLQQLKVTDVYGGHWCTYLEPERFYSYRRDGVCGRMASLIWLREQTS